MVTTRSASTAAAVHRGEQGSPRRRATLTRLAAASIAAIAVGVLAVDSAKADPLKKRGVEVLELKVRNDQYTAVDLGPAGPSLGDMAITGGTGVYGNARGIARFWDIATPNERVRLEILR